MYADFGERSWLAVLSTDVALLGVNLAPLLPGRHSIRRAGTFDLIGAIIFWRISGRVTDCLLQRLSLVYAVQGTKEHSVALN